MATYTGADKRLQYLFEHGGGGGGSANIWTGTLAEYIAQASQIANETQVNITDDEIQSLVVASYDVFSTQEKEVGVWTDGKPLYQRTIIKSISVSSGSYATIEQLSDIDHLQAKSGIFLESGVIYILNEMSNRISFNKSTGALVFSAASGSAWSGEISLTIQYTKTTDVAGAGLFVPSGVLAKHYSTEEQVIGTWLGKPLYSKVLPEISFNGNGYDYSHNIGIKHYINIGGRCTVNGGSNPVPFPFYQSRWNGYCGIRSADENSIYFDSNWSGTNTVQAYIEYTKTSDYT